MSFREMRSSWRVMAGIELGPKSFFDEMAGAESEARAEFCDGEVAGHGLGDAVGEA